MTKRESLLLLAPLLVWQTCCLSTKFTNRYKTSIYHHEAGEKPVISLKAFVLDVPDETKKSLLSELSPQGQNGLLREISKKTSSIDAFWNALNDGKPDDKATKGIIDATRFKKRVVFSVEKQLADGSNVVGPADRVSEILVELNLPNAVHFLSWNRFETKYESIDLGKINATQTAQAGLEWNMVPETKILPSAIPLSAQFSRNMTEEVSLKQRYVAISGALAPQSARLYQQGVVGIDLAGNFIVDFDVEIDKEQVSEETVVALENLDSEEGPNQAGKVHVRFLRFIYPKTTEPVENRIVYDYILRHVVRNDQTVSESDDDVVFIKGRGDFAFNLISEAELKATIYVLRSHHLSDAKPSKYGYELRLTGIGPIAFSSYTAAAKFLNWLRQTQETRVGIYGLELNGKTLNIKDIPSLEIEANPLNHRPTMKSKEE